MLSFLLQLVLMVLNECHPSLQSFRKSQREGKMERSRIHSPLVATTHFMFGSSLGPD
jgi:hypothetical protein